MALHKDLTGADLHEPKGASSASAGQVYVADGAGSGAWTDQAGSFVPLTVRFDDVSTADEEYIVAPVAGTISAIFAVLKAAITVADATISFTIDGVAVDDADITIAESGSAPGSEFDSAPSGHNTVAVGSVIKVSTDGNSTTTAPLTVTVLIHV